MYLTLLMLIILFACVACLYTEGLWGNAIRLINVVTAALLATNFFEPVANYLDEQLPSYTYLWDFLAIWALFVIFLSLLRGVTDYASRVKVRFHNTVDQIGSAVLAIWVGWVMVCFTMMSLHTAPLARNFLQENFQPEQSMFLGMTPDRQWLGFTQRMSLGTFCRSATPEEWQEEEYVFDPQGLFMPTYATRRANLESHNKSTGTIRLNR